MAKMEGTYIQVAYKNVCGYISTNSWPFFMLQRPTIRKKCAWVRSNTWRDERPVFFSFSIFRQTLQLATEKIQNLCNRNRWSGLLQLGSVRFGSFFQSSELDLRTLGSTSVHPFGSIKQHQTEMSGYKMAIKGCRWLSIVLTSTNMMVIIMRTLHSSTYSRWTPVDSRWISAVHLLFF